MKTIEITGGTITLREREDLRVRDRQFLQESLVDVIHVLQPLIDDPALQDEEGEFDEQKAMADGRMTSVEVGAFYKLIKAGVVARLSAWSLPGKPPQSIEDVDDIPASVYDALTEPVMDGLMEMVADVDFEHGNPNDPGFSETPTEPSVA